ncbi:MEDS domain-containing protein [Streptomyces sp. NPDC050315]|uniref:MEDS domain-containing protein n=1 Tax=Streptomyces sp. NPDC050315 TaxID=3155039 RepID=UPI003430994B
MNQPEHRPPAPPIKHHVGVHSSDEEFLTVVVPFLREGIAAEDEPDPLAITTPRKLDLLRDALGSDARHVDFLDSARWYRGTPANGLAFALDYYAAHAGPQGRIHMTGEPVWDGRSPRQIADWTRYEALCTELFTGYPPDLMCLYDTRTAPPAVVDAARRTHPTELGPDGVRASRLFTEPRVYAALSSDPLPTPPPDAARLSPPGDTAMSHRFVAEQALARGMTGEEAGRFGEAVSGATAYAASQGCADDASMVLWSTRERIVCELRTSRGRITDPFLGFRPPGPEARPDDGLWRTRQICEFVDLFAGEQGWSIRMEAALVPSG